MIESRSSSAGQRQCGISAQAARAKLQPEKLGYCCTHKNTWAKQHMYSSSSELIQGRWACKKCRWMDTDNPWKTRVRTGKVSGPDVLYET